MQGASLESKQNKRPIPHRGNFFLEDEQLVSNLRIYFPKLLEKEEAEWIRLGDRILQENRRSSGLPFSAKCEEIKRIIATEGIASDALNMMGPDLEDGAHRMKAFVKIYLLASQFSSMAMNPIAISDGKLSICPLIHSRNVYSPPVGLFGLPIFNDSCVVLFGSAFRIK